MLAYIARVVIEEVDKVNRLKQMQQNIAALEEESMSLRDKISLLENQEAKISEAIMTKKKQLDTLKLFNKE